MPGMQKQATMAAFNQLQAARLRTVQSATMKSYPYHEAAELYIPGNRLSEAEGGISPVSWSSTRK
jgi:hypothetical protein